MVGTPLQGAAFFSADYATAKRRFISAARARARFLHSFTLNARAPDAAALTIDIAWLGPQAATRSIIHSCGLHGVEGFAGSAIQLALLEDPPLLQGGSALILVNVLNPYGMAWLRRVNENNVDLNRNFLIGGSNTPARLKGIA